MGLLSRGMFGQGGMSMNGPLGPRGQMPGYGGQMGQPPPQMQRTGQGMPGAFGGNPQFMAQLQQMMQMQPLPQPSRVGVPQQPPAGVGGMGAGMSMGGIDPAMGSGFGMGGHWGARPGMPMGDTSFDMMYGARV